MKNWTDFWSPAYPSENSGILTKITPFFILEQPSKIVFVIL